MRYARMDAFEKVKSLAKSEDAKVVKAAFKAPKNMPKPSEQELAAILVPGHKAI